MTIDNVTRHSLLVAKGELANSFWTRLKGLIGHRPLQQGQGMLIRPCNWIHTFLMGFPIDVIYVDRSNRIVGLTEYIAPNRLGPPMFAASFVVELPAGVIARSGTAVGDVLAIET
jgi:uncharacterized membrane protein (UPF0127 family)